MKLSEHKVYVDAWRYEAVMLFDEDASHYAEMLVEAHDVIAQLKEELETYRERHRDAKSNFAVIQRLRTENSLREAENVVLFVMLDTYDEEIERLKRRAESIECAECGKNNYNCDCPDMMALDEQV